ncbi:MAG TPA: hypothetical protein PK566_18315 [Pseudobacteroides sp.]|nr:hypothetical protein [Pseudobacteroides sp.]
MKVLIYKTLRIFCLGYIIIGLIIWLVSFVNTSYNDININQELIGVDGHTSYMWEQHDKIWSVYEKYSIPFLILTLPFYMILGSAVSDGKISFRIYDAICLYYLFMPVLILWLGIKIKNKNKKVV